MSERGEAVDVFKLPLKSWEPFYAVHRATSSSFNTKTE